MEKPIPIPSNGKFSTFSCIVLAVNYCCSRRWNAKTLSTIPHKTGGKQSKKKKAVQIYRLQNPGETRFLAAERYDTLGGYMTLAADAPNKASQYRW